MRARGCVGQGAAVVGHLCLAAALWAQPPEGPWRRHVIDDSSRGADGTRLADVNGDKLPDFVTGWEEGGRTRAYLHPGYAKVRDKWPAVTVGPTASVEDAVFVDLDGDGATDVVTCCEGKTRSMFVHWAPPDRQRWLDANAWRTEPIPAAKGAMAWMFCLPMQIDGQCGVDLIAGAKGTGAKVGWLQSPPDARDLKAWKFHPLIDAAWIMSLIAADMDGDGDQDVLVSERKGKQSGCYWLENPGPGAGEKLKQPWIRHWIGSRGKEVMFIRQADLDGDGRLDVIAAQKPREIAFHRRKAADGKQWQTRLIATPPSAGRAKAVNVGDIDGDGRADLVFSCEGADTGRSGVMWLSAPTDPSQTEWTAHDIAGPKGVKYDLVELIDLDGDGDLDVLTCEERELNAVFWYENPTRSGRSDEPMRAK